MPFYSLYSKIDKAAISLKAFSQPAIPMGPVTQCPNNKFHRHQKANCNQNDLITGDYFPLGCLFGIASIFIDNGCCKKGKGRIRAGNVCHGPLFVFSRL